MLRCPRTGVLLDTGHRARDGVSLPLSTGTVSVLCGECGDTHRAPMNELVIEPAE